MHGSHGWFRKTNPYEESCRVPFIISTGHSCMYSVAPGLLYGANNACLCDAPLNHVDVAPTTMPCAGQLLHRRWKQFGTLEAAGYNAVAFADNDDIKVLGQKAE